MPKDGATERRAGARFPIALKVRYVVSVRRGSKEIGFGRTIDLSSSGLRFAADRPLEVGQKLHIYIEWPVLLGGGVQLQLVILGHVVRTDGLSAALRIERHEFKTRRGGLNVVPPQESFG